MKTAYKVPPLSWAQIDRVAHSLLDSLFPQCLETPQAVPIQSILEIGLYKHFSIGFGVDNLPYGTEAFFNAEIDEIILDFSVHEGLLQNNPRDRFTAAHEIGHAMLHRGIFKGIHAGSRSAQKFNRGSMPAYMDSEAQANRFGSAFLMPTPTVNMVINQGGGVHDIMDIYNASFTAAQIKYNEILKKLSL